MSIPAPFIWEYPLGLRQSKIWVSRDMHCKNLKVILLVLAFFIRYFFRTINLIQLGLFCLPSNWNTIFFKFWDKLWRWSRSIVLPCTTYGPDQASAKSTVPNSHKILSCPMYRAVPKLKPLPGSQIVGTSPTQGKRKKDVVWRGDSGAFSFRSPWALFASIFTISLHY